MDLKAYVMKGIELVKLNGEMAETVAADEEAFVPAVIFYAVGGLAAGIGAAFTGSFSMIIYGPIAGVVFSFIGVGILYLIAKLFGGTGDFVSYYRALGVGSLPQWAGIIPVLGGIVGLWTLPVAVIVTERVHKLPRGKAIAVVLIPVAVLLVLGIIAFVAGMAFMGMMGGAAMMKGM